jgi:hypothetical protein
MSDKRIRREQEIEGGTSIKKPKLKKPKNLKQNTVVAVIPLGMGNVLRIMIVFMKSTTYVFKLEECNGYERILQAASFTRAKNRTQFANEQIAIEIKRTGCAVMSLTNAERKSVIGWIETLLKTGEYIPRSLKSISVILDWCQTTGTV